MNKNDDSISDNRIMDIRHQMEEIMLEMMLSVLNRLKQQMLQVDSKGEIKF